MWMSGSRRGLIPSVPRKLFPHRLFQRSASAASLSSMLGCGLAGGRFPGWGAAPCAGFRAGRLHRQRDPLGLRVGAQHVNLHDLADLHHIARLLDVAVRQFADVHQSILMDAHVDEGSELGHVGDHAFERHPLPQVADLLYVVLETGRHKLVARIASRLAELFQNVVQGVDAGGEAALVDFRRAARAARMSCSIGNLQALAQSAPPPDRTRDERR